MSPAMHVKHVMHAMHIINIIRSARPVFAVLCRRMCDSLANSGEIGGFVPLISRNADDTFSRPGAA